MTRLSVLAVDDETPALEELRYLLTRDPRVGTVRTATDAPEALRQLREHHVDIVMLDIRMPGLTGMESGEDVPAVRRAAGDRVRHGLRAVRSRGVRG